MLIGTQPSLLIAGGAFGFIISDPAKESTYATPGPQLFDFADDIKSGDTVLAILVVDNQRSTNSWDTGGFSAITDVSRANAALNIGQVDSAIGNESGTQFEVTTAGAEQDGGCVCLRIRGHLSGQITWATNTDGGEANPINVVLDTGGDEVTEKLFVIACGVEVTAPTGAPPGYTMIGRAASNDGELVVAYRFATNSIETPGRWVSTSNDASVTFCAGFEIAP